MKAEIAWVGRHGTPHYCGAPTYVGGLVDGLLDTLGLLVAQGGAR